MDLAAGCKDKLQYFRVKELKDVLTHLGLSKQGKKQDLVDRILAVLVDDQVAKIMARRPTFSKEDVAKLVEDTYRKMQGCGAMDLASNVHDTPGKMQGCGAMDLASNVHDTPDTSHTITLKPKEEVDDSFNLDMKVRCPCGSSLLTESMIRCEDANCQVWQHISCVIIPEKPLDGIPPVPNQFYCEICRLSRADPFWSTVAHLLLPVKLMTTVLPIDGSNPVQAADKTFHLTRTDRESLSKPGYAVQAWCLLFNDKVPFRMQWPQYADLQVNGVPVRAVSRPGSQLLGANGRDDGPTISQFTRDGINKISITGCDARIFCFGVRLVKRRTLQQILSNIPKVSDGECFEDALARVIRCVSGGAAENADSDSDLEVVADSFTINLRCPMSGSRMKTAGRFRPCVHMGCFDLDTFVEMQQRSRKWQCPICLKNYSLEHIIIDPYFNLITTMMDPCGEDTTEIEVKADGSWRVKSDCDRKDLKQWHRADGSIYHDDEGESKHNTESSKPVKQEGSSLKLGIRKNRNGVWEVSKHEDGNTLSSSERVPENGGSGRAGDDTSVSQDGNVHFDLAANNGIGLGSTSLNFEPSYGLASQTSQAVEDANVIVLLDSDEENDSIGHRVVHNSGVIDHGDNRAVGPHGNTGFYQDEHGLGVSSSSCFDLFKPADDEYELPMWQLPSTTQAGSCFQLFGSDGNGSDTLAHTNHNSVNCPTLMNDFILAPQSVLNSSILVPPNSVDHFSDDLNAGLVDNPLAFCGEDPSLQIFLPTRPTNISGQTETRSHQDVANGISDDDWISLRLGDGSGSTQKDSGAMIGMNSGQQSHEAKGTTSSMAETAFLLGSNGDKTEKMRERSGSPRLFLQQKRPVKPRLYFSIDSD